MAGHYRAVAVASVLCLGAHAGWGGDRMPGGDSSDSTASNDMVAGWHNYSCSGTFAYQSNSPEEVCDELGIKSYALEEEHFAICRWCSDLNPPPPPPGPIIVLPPCPLGSHGHGWQCHANHVCEAGQIGGGATDCQDCGDNSSPNSSGSACECNQGYDDPDGDGDCTLSCPSGDLDAVTDAYARNILLKIPKVPWEDMQGYGCTGGAIKTTEGASTRGLYRYLDFPTNKMKNPNEGSVCNLSMDGAVTNIAYGHSHPHFVWGPTRRDHFVKCWSSRIASPSDVDDLNRENMRFSEDDKSGAETREKPLYLVVPKRNAVRVYRQNDQGKWVDRLVQ